MKNPPEEDLQETIVLGRALRALSDMTTPLYDGSLMLDGINARQLTRFVRAALIPLRDALADASAMLAARRRKQSTRALRVWAKKATLKEAHAATKPLEFTAAYSASSSRDHVGEMTAQEAADGGLVEWSSHWNASDRDQGAHIQDLVMQVVSRGPRAWYVPNDGCHDPLPLPPIDGKRIDRTSKRFKGTTGIGFDWLRLRHISWLPAEAKEGLAMLLMFIERVMKWPSMARGVIAVALSKKGGGSRLIGLLTALYRLWAKLRYEDVQEALESRLARPFLAAAPGEGAAKAAAVAALLGESAWARGEVAATTLADVAKFYEQVTFDEIVQGAAAFGIPAPIIALALHQYAGPRRIRVGKAFSAAAYPRRSIVPGCTWATVLIRTIIVGPAERF